MKAESSVGIESLSAELENMQQKMKEFKFSHDCETIYFLGVTGSGKSTTINYFLNKGPLPQKKVRRDYQIKSIEGGPQIGHTNTSCTEIPAIYKDPSGDRVYIDPPGFMDTKGPMQETTNGLCNALMFDRGVKAKIILVIDDSTIRSGRGGIIPEIAKRLFDLFGRDFDRLINSILILVTKVDSEDIEIEYIVDDLRSIAQKNENMTGPIKAMIAGVIENNNVLMLPLPKQVEQDTIPKLLSAVEKAKPTTLSCQANISLSYEAKGMLQDLADLISQEVNSSIKQIHCDLQNRFSNVSYSSGDECGEIINKLKIAQNSIDKQVSQSWLQGFTNFASQVDLKPSITQKVVSNANKMGICSKLNLPVKLNIGLVQAISTCLTGMIANLQSKMSEFMTQKQIKEMDARHQKSLEDRNAQFNQTLAQMKSAADARERAIQQQIQWQKDHSDQIMRKASKQHAEQIEAMKAQIKAQKEKKKQPPQQPLIGIMMLSLLEQSKQNKAMQAQIEESKRNQLLIEQKQKRHALQMETMQKEIQRKQNKSDGPCSIF